MLDASVLIEYLRRRDARLAQALGELELGICGVTRAEMLHGARDDTDWQKLVVLLNQFTALPISETLWDEVGRRLYALRARGIVVPFTDVVLATLALNLNVEVWTYDRHFELIASVLPLRLYQLEGGEDLAGS